MKLDQLFENTISLRDLYDDDELNDESESLYHWIDDEDLSKEFIVKTMSPEVAKQYTTPRDDTTVYDSYLKYATKDQKNIVNQKIKRYDLNRIIVVMNHTVIDGNHQLIAGILANKPIKYIDLSD